MAAGGSFVRLAPGCWWARRNYLKGSLTPGFMIRMLTQSSSASSKGGRRSSAQSASSVRTVAGAPYSALSPKIFDASCRRAAKVGVKGPRAGGFSKARTASSPQAERASVVTDASPGVPSLPSAFLMNPRSQSSLRCDSQIGVDAASEERRGTAQSGLMTPAFSPREPSPGRNHQTSAQDSRGLLRGLPRAPADPPGEV